MQTSVPVVVFADLDDTLFASGRDGIDDATRDALQRVASDDIPIVLSSGRTRAEVEMIQQDLDIRHPFLCENGAAVFVPRGYFSVDVPNARDIAGYEAVELGKPYAEVVPTLHGVAARLGIEVIGFSDMSVEEVAAECHLSLLRARLAKLREYNEPFRLRHDDARSTGRLLKALRTAGLACTSRGRYYHAGSVSRDIGVQMLCGLYRRALGTIAVADLEEAVQ